jgi:hypothetical protein
VIECISEENKMTKRWITAAVAAALCALTGCTAGPAPSDESAEERESVGAVQSDLQRDPTGGCTCPPFTEPLGQFCWVTSKTCIGSGKAICSYRCEPIEEFSLAP